MERHIDGIKKDSQTVEDGAGDRQHHARLGPEGLGYIVPTTTELRPEFAYAGEIGTRAAFRRIEGGASYAYTLIDNVIAATPTSVAGQTCCTHRMRLVILPHGPHSLPSSESGMV